MFNFLIEVRHSFAMTLLSNNNGSFEYLGRNPYVPIMFHEINTETV